MLVMLVANLIILPVAISFFNDDLSIHWVVFNCGSDTVFLMDIKGPVRFRIKKLGLGASSPPNVFNGRLGMDDFAVYKSY